MSVPLADRIRPTTLDDMVGQPHLLGPGRPLRRIIESGQIPNMVFYGPAGVGKTTLASIIAAGTDRQLRRLNGTNASIADIRAIVDELDTLTGRGGILLYLDEIQYFNKKQQQSLLEYIEDGRITLVASTTENPYFYVYNAILSRTTVFEFTPLTKADIRQALVRAFRILSEETSARGETLTVDDAAIDTIAGACGGDTRKALNAAELSLLAAPLADGARHITAALAGELTQRSSMRYDREGDEHYDILSAYQKSMRGSDPDAALHYLARLLEAGDLPSACRRLMVCACEDVGLAYPQIISIVKAAVDAALMLGLPEAEMPLSAAVALVARSPKSNSANVALAAATADIRAGKGGEVPPHLKDAHYKGAEKLGRGLTYQYAHSFPNHYVAQQYLPDALKNAHYYVPGDNKTEQAAEAYWARIRGEDKK